MPYREGAADEAQDGPIRPAFTDEGRDDGSQNNDYRPVDFIKGKFVDERPSDPEKSPECLSHEVKIGLHEESEELTSEQLGEILEEAGQTTTREEASAILRSVFPNLSRFDHDGPKIQKVLRDTASLIELVNMYGMRNRVFGIEWTGAAPTLAIIKGVKEVSEYKDGDVYVSYDVGYIREFQFTRAEKPNYQTEGFDPREFGMDAKEINPAYDEWIIDV